MFFFKKTTTLSHLHFPAPRRRGDRRIAPPARSPGPLFLPPPPAPSLPFTPALSWPHGIHGSHTTLRLMAPTGRFLFLFGAVHRTHAHASFFFLAPRSRITMARGTNRLLYRLPLRWICGCCLHQPRCGLHLLKDYLGGSRRWGVGQTVNMHVSSSSYVTCVYPPPYRSRHSGVGQTVNIHTHTHIYTNTHIHTYKWRYTYICTGVHIYMCVWEAALGRGTHGTNS